MNVTFHMELLLYPSSDVKVQRIKDRNRSVPVTSVLKYSKCNERNEYH
jgi:hypothetical protein